VTDTSPLPLAVLLQRARCGEHAAVRELLERNLDWLRDRVRRRLSAALRRELDSGDLVQDVVVSLLARPEAIPLEDEEHFRALLVRIVDADVYDRLRWQGRERRNRQRERPLPADGSTSTAAPIDSVTRPSQHVERDDRAAWIRAAMLRLDPTEQRLLQLRIWQQQPFAAIGAELGIAEDAARMRVNRALGRLARAVAGLRAAPRA
jgi:RNA polymerase sigma factor (sigma-70 family)